MTNRRFAKTIDAQFRDWYLTINDLVEDLLKPIENGLGSLLGKTVSFDPLRLQE